MEEIRNHKFIILCEDHYNPLSLVRTLGLDGIEPIIVLIGGEQAYLVPASKYANNVTNVSSAEEGLNLIIDKYGNEEYKPFLFTCDDYTATLVDNNYSKLISHFFFFNAGKDGRVSEFMDKEGILLAAKECNLEIPESERLPLGKLPSKLSYPVITKSIRSTEGGWKNDVFVCYSENELKTAYQAIKSNPVLVEEFIEKENELCIDGISIKGGDEVYMPFKANYLRFTNKAYGNYMTISPFEDEELAKKIQSLIKKIGYTGIFCIEFLITKDGHYKLLEINFRYSAWAISSKVGGADLPLIWAKSTLKGELDLTDITLQTIPFTAMAELADFNDHVRHGNLSVRQWIREFRACPCTYFYHSEDKKPFFKMIGHSFGLLFNKFFKKR